MPYLHKHPKSPYWSAWFVDQNGQRTSRSTKQRDKREALKIAVGWEEGAKSAREGTLAASQVLKVYNFMLAKSGQRVTAESVETFSERWLKSKHSTRAKRTADTYEPIITSFLESLGARKKAPINAIVAGDVERHRDKLTAEGKKASTIRNALKIIGSMFLAASRQGLVDGNPVPSVEINDAPQQQREPFSTDEINLLLTHSDSEWKTAILLGAFAGMRLGDSVRLSWEDVDLEKRLITFTPEKTSRKGRVVEMPICERLYSHLMDLAGDSGGPLCPSLRKLGTGGRYGLSGRFKVIMDHAGISNRIVAQAKGKGRTQSAKSFHSLRHSFNTALANAGVEEKVRMELSGHSTTSANRRYSHTELETMRAAVNKLPS